MWKSFVWCSVLALALALCAAPGIVAQQGGAAAGGGKKPLTIETIFGGGRSAPAPSQMRWAPDGRLSYFLRGEEGGRDLWVLDPATGEKSMLIGAKLLRDLAPSPAQATRSERERTRRTRFGVAAYRWSPDGGSLLLTSAGRIFVYHLAGQESVHLAPAMEGVRDPKFSPDGNWISFVHEHDIWIVPVAGGEPTQLTTGGHDLLLHGDLDWVYPEEFGVRTGYHWSPGSTHIAFLEMDESSVPTYPITEQVSNQATVDLQRYPKAGDPNPKVRVGIVNIETGRTAWIDRAAEYIPRLQWAGAEDLSVQLLNRGQNELELIFVDPDTGKSSTVFAERDKHWINVTNDLTFLSNGREFLWTSERTGLRHIYLYDRSGKLVRQLTGLATGSVPIQVNGEPVEARIQPEWQVGSIAGVDEENGWVYYTANAINSIGSDLFRVKLGDPGKVELLGRERGTHRINMNLAATAYVDSSSAMTRLPRSRVNHLPSGRGTELSAARSLEEFDLVTPETRMLETKDRARVSLRLLKPARLEKNKKYPVVVYAYGMPGFPTIRDSWGGRRYLWHQFLVQQGYVVAQIDDSTSAVWGHKYATRGYHNIGPVAAEDHKVAVEYLKSLPYVDGERMGLWGWSGGGFTTTFHMTHTDLFKVGVAGAPVTDWRLYDSIYTERYMGRPQDDPEAYERTSAVKAAANMTGRMLLIYGTHDDNVHPQNTIQLVNGLIKARKKFDVMFYPNKTHGITGRDETIHLYTMIFDYLERHLKP